MFKPSVDYGKLKTNLRIGINRLKLMSKKKTENALKYRKEIADLIQGRKEDRARIKVEHIVREDYMAEAMELMEMYADLLLARFGLIEMQKELDAGLEEAIATIIWAAPRLQSEVAELKIIANQLSQKYGQEFASECRKNGLNNVNEKVMHKLGVQAPPKSLVEKYMIEIAGSYNIPFEPDEAALREEEPYLGELISVNNTDVRRETNEIPGGPSNAEKPPLLPTRTDIPTTGLVYPGISSQKPPIPPELPSETGRHEVGFRFPMPLRNSEGAPPPNYSSNVTDSTTIRGSDNQNEENSVSAKSYSNDVLWDNTTYDADSSTFDVTSHINDSNKGRK